MAGAPDDVVEQTQRLGEAVAATIVSQTPSNVVIGTWNLRAFGGLTASWQSKKSDSPKRDWRAIEFIAEIIRRCDVFALQEIRREPTAIKHLLARLGAKWRVIVSDVTEGDAGNDERLAFVYNSERVQPSGLVGELVLPEQARRTRSPVRAFAICSRLCPRID